LGRWSSHCKRKIGRESGEEKVEEPHCSLKEKGLCEHGKKKVLQKKETAILHLGRRKEEGGVKNP